jgi:hypothetical protein
MYNIAPVLLLIIIMLQALIYLLEIHHLVPKNDPFPLLFTVLQQVEVTVNVLNVNDEPPRFITKPTPYLAVVATDAQAGVSVFRIEAEDVDGGPNAVKYFKENGMSKACFHGFVM